MSTGRYMVGATMVLADRHGPYQFRRRDAAGQWVEVPCICDPAHNLVCAFHSHQETSPVVYQDDRRGYWGYRRPSGSAWFAGIQRCENSAGYGPPAPVVAVMT